MDIKELQRDVRDLDLRILEWMEWMFGMLAGQTALIVTRLKILGH